MNTLLSTFKNPSLQNQISLEEIQTFFESLITSKIETTSNGKPTFKYSDSEKEVLKQLMQQINNLAENFCSTFNADSKEIKALLIETHKLRTEAMTQYKSRSFFGKYRICSSDIAKCIDDFIEAITDKIALEPAAALKLKQTAARQQTTTITDPEPVVKSEFRF